ncbi:hypothetical protein EWM62_18120 [Mucilaginibacter terrigena]|uniref:DUF4293 family protein n=1 Tax=Mucilaginibacter terrigena TaxID=2492395 RepID=A0A4Q5LH70_9SPHI|nr:hypothetical protein [Mucilaginibacter terrigena]RYU86570.1 hypothetical protein EWM62_18120 [Mucilaginibacter terrigena]
MAAVHPNYIKSSNLIILSMLVGLMSLAFAQEPLKTLPAVLSVIITILFLGVIAFLVRRGISWMKYVLLVVFILGLAALILLIIGKQHVRTGALVVNILQTLIQLWALIRLFTIPKSPGKVSFNK